jgi:hypothetical protein
MKLIFHSVAIAGLLSMATPSVFAGDAPKDATESKATPAPPAASEPSLRKPGFMFMELGTERVDDYFSFFASVAGFRLTRRMPGYIDSRSDLAELTFVAPKFWGKGHPFNGKITGSGQGVGIEIGIVVADLDKSYAAALAFKDKGFPISTGIVRRPWGVRDFRVLAPDGYYFRFTEGH